jgi:hypothetical protein
MAHAMAEIPLTEPPEDLEIYTQNLVELVRMVQSNRTGRGCEQEFPSLIDSGL